MKKLFFILLILFSNISLFSQRIRVPQDHAKIQEAIDIASSGDTILVDEGTYIENLVIPRKELTIGSLYLVTGDTSYISKTIIDGNQNGPAVYFSAGEMPENRFTGFTIRNGNGESGIGGGIYISMASPILDHLKIINNTANRGGAVACMGSPGLNLTHSVLSFNNASNRGGAIFAVNSGLRVSHCLISENNIAGGIGGALYYTFGVDMPQAPEVKLNNVEILNNSATGTGATSGAYFESSSGMTDLNILIESCLFQGNKSIGNTALRIHGQHMDARVVNCSFLANEAEQYGGGAVFTSGCTAEVLNCLFISNQAATGGGEYNSGAVTIWRSEVDFYNCTFTDNSAFYGTVMTIAAGKALLENCILWDNHDNQIALVDANQQGGEVTIGYCNVQNEHNSVSISTLSELLWKEGNISIDPLFKNDGDHPYCLDTGSPCIDAGNPETGNLPDMPCDFLGNARIWDGDDNESAVIDMGPYEYGSEIIISGIIEHEIIQYSDIVVNVYPNPFPTFTTLEYNLIHPENVILFIFEHSGRLVFSIQEYQSQGLQKLNLTLQGLVAGMYYFRLEAGDKIATGKLSVLK